MTANIALLAAVVLFVLQNPNSSTAVSQNAVSDNRAATNPLDQLSSAEIAVHISKLANMDIDEQKAVVNNADSVNAELSFAPADDKMVAKPQVVNTALKSKKDIVKYTTVQGDTVASVAAKFNVTSDSVRWSNGLTGNNVAVSKELLISPISNGIVYIVKQGDTPDSVAQRFRANKDQIIAFNDAEVGGLKAGEAILVPDGSIQPVVAYVAASTRNYSVGGSYNAVFGGNGYPFGQCTWWASYRRAQIGKPVPSNLGNARTWKQLSQMAGIPGGTTPVAGAVIWFPPGGQVSSLGHVGFVERVNTDGSVYMSDMNWYGGAEHIEYMNGRRVTYRTIPAGQLGGYYFIY